jgi:hypothetical protein
VRATVREEEVMAARGGQRVLISVVGGGSPLLWGNIFQLLRRDAGIKCASSALQRCSFFNSSNVLSFSSRQCRTFHGTDG